MGIINILDKTTANLIAAGEVVERPASAIKELLENSADAGAARVTVEIKNGGKTYIRITDNGCGMSKDDVPNCILRHATSKIKVKEDLYKIGTLGFRGEALAAICAVCNFKIFTKQKGDLAGTLLEAQNGEITEISETGCPDGTTVIAERIFENIPARLKFLKKDFSEAAAVFAVCEKFALSKPYISLTFISDGVTKLQTAGDGNLKNTIYSVLGKDFSENLIPIDYTLGCVHSYGFIGKPQISRPNRNLQNFFVNGRYVKSRTIMAALEEGFRAFCPAGKFPAAVINCTLDLTLVDVNIHPAKIEVKFSNEKQIFDSVYFAVKNALSVGASVLNDKMLNDEQEFNTSCPLLTKDISIPLKASLLNETTLQKSANEKPLNEIHSEEKSPEENSADKDHFISCKGNSAEEDLKQLFSDEREDTFVGNISSIPTSVSSPSLFAEQSKIDIQNLQISILTPSKKTFDEHQLNNIEENTSQQHFFESAPNENQFRIIGEAFNLYIIVEKDEELYLIDKHAAHERIIYESIKNKCFTESQMLLEPITVNLTPKEAAAVIDNLELFKDTCFDIEPFGRDSVILRSIPDNIPLSEINDTVIYLAGKLSEGNMRVSPDFFDRILFSTACKAAIKAGQKNSYFRNEWICEKLFTSDAIAYCPHGRPVIVKFSKDKLDKMFKRT